MLRSFSSTALRVIAIACTVAFVNLEFVALVGHGPLVASASAQTAGPKQVALFVLPKRSKDTSVALALQTILRAELSGLENVRAVSGSPIPRANLVATVGRHVEDGYRALNGREFAGAERHFETAFNTLIRSDGAFDRRIAARCLKGLGIARVANGKSAQGKVDIAASLNLWADQESLEYGYTLDTRNAFRDVQREREEQGNGSIRIDSSPPGAEIRVDDQARGFSNDTVTGLAPGLHWVQLQLDGYEISGRFVTVKPGETASHSAPLRVMANSAAYDTVMKRISKGFKSRAKMVPLMPALLSLLGADAVVFLKAAPGADGYSLVGWSADDTGSLEPVREVLGTDDQMLSNAAKLLGRVVGAEVVPKGSEPPLDAPAQTSIGGSDAEPEIFIDPNDPILREKKKEEGESVTSKWWFWVIVGAVVGGVTAGAVALLSSEGESKGPVGDIRVNLHGAP